MAIGIVVGIIGLLEILMVIPLGEEEAEWYFLMLPRFLLIVIATIPEGTPLLLLMLPGALMIVAGTILVKRGRRHLVATYEARTRVRKQRYRAWLLIAVGILLMTISGSKLMLNRSLLDGLLFGLVSWLGVRWFNRGRRLAWVGAPMDAEATEDARVLYLRSFGDDAVMATVWGPGSYLFDTFAFRTEEEQLMEALRPIGSTLAIGKPGEALPELGASRRYLTDEEWQGEVSKAMARAELVVLRPGSSQGVWWELSHAIGNLPPEKLVLVLPFDAEGYESFRRRFEDLLGRELPDYHFPGKRVGSLHALLYFERDWTPRFVPLHSGAVGFFRKSIRPTAAAFRMGFRPVFESLGVEWTPPPISALRVSGIGVLALFLLLVAIDSLLWLSRPR